MNDIVAGTERLVLRRERAGDLATWLVHMNTPEVMEKVGGVQPREKVVEGFARMASAADEPLGFYLVALKGDGTLIGKAGLSRIDTPQAPQELQGAIQAGWTLRADFWGQGYAREAAEAALALGFERVGSPRIYAQTSERNAASWGLMKRLGMTRRADLDYDDPDYPPEDNPTMVWHLDRDAWAAERGFSLETERLVLRDWREGDAEAFFRATNTERVMRWLGGLLDEGSRAGLLERVGSCRAANGFCFWIVERRADGEVLGFCGLKRADAPGSTIAGEFEIGWRLREDAWGQGYAKEAASASLDAAFDRFGAEEVYALTVKENEPSWGLMKRLGMRRRAELDYLDPRFDKPLSDTIVYSIGRDQWEICA